MKTIIITLGLLIGAGMILPVSSYAQSTTKEAQVAKRVAKKEFKEYLENNKEVQLIDVRTPGEFGQGTIEGATNIDFYDPNFKKEIAKLDKSVPTLIFCRSGGRSAKALEQFKAEGFVYVLELEGGFMNW